MKKHDPLTYTIDYFYKIGLCHHAFRAHELICMPCLSGQVQWLHYAYFRLRMIYIKL